MSQQQPPEHRTGATSPGLTTGAFIEKGWTVYDALERPIGNVTEVDTGRDLLEVDGRAQGFGSYELPLSFVENAGSNEVHLSKVVETDVSGTGGAPRFVDRRVTTTPSGTTQTRSRSRAESTTTSTTSRPRVHAAETTETPANAEAMREFSPPYASRHPTMGPEGQTPSWGTQNEEGWTTKKIAMAGLAVGGLAASAYLMRRRMRRKSRFEQIADMVTDYVDVASEFTRNRHPAWWASLAATALPLVYYAWPKSRPTSSELAMGRAGDLSSYLAGITSMLPGMAERRPSMMDRMRHQMARSAMSSARPMMLARWRSTGQDSTWNFSPRPDMAGTLGALAAGALGIYLLRRMAAKPPARTRIAEVMTRRPRVIQPDATVADAAAIMRRLDVGALPVCDGTRLIGMLTDRDITTRATADGRDPHLTLVRDVMSPGVAWATEDDPVEAAARIMREHRIRRLPIVDERHSLVGVVSLGDLAVEVADDDMSSDTLERVSEQTRAPRDW